MLPTQVQCQHRIYCDRPRVVLLPAPTWHPSRARPPPQRAELPDTVVVLSSREAPAEAQAMEPPCSRVRDSSRPDFYA